MKIFKKAILAAMIVAAMPLIAAEDENIYVTTLEDEDNVNNGACSLREALKASELNRAYGGCSAGKKHDSVFDNIVIEVEGEIKLNAPLVINSQVNIYGVPPEDLSRLNILTNTYPALTANKVTINGQNKYVIFDNINSRKPFNLVNLDIAHGKGVRGGAIRAGSSISLTRVTIRDSEATERGGAIYFEGQDSGLTSNHLNITGNTAPKGAVFDMTCRDSLGYTKHNFELSSGSIYRNGDSNSSSLFEFCGNVTTKFLSNTIAQNNASPSTGSIIKFTGDSFGANDLSILSSNSSIQLTNNTIVENAAAQTFLYDAIGSKALTYNILSYNQGKSCAYLLGDVSDKEKLNIVAGLNALQWGTDALSACELPKDVMDNNDALKNKNFNGVALSTILSPLQLPKEINDFKALYYPINNKTTNSVVDIDFVDCHAVDQRGLNRVVDGTLVFDPENANTCDMGAVELYKLTAADITDVNTTSQLETENFYDGEQKRFNTYYEEETKFPDAKAYYKTMSDLNQKRLDHLKANPIYRASYVEIFSLSQAEEYQDPAAPNGVRKMLSMNADNYDVIVEAIGTGPDTISKNLDPENVARPDADLKCEWDAVLERVVIYRTDDQISQAGDYAYCKYTLIPKSDPTVKSSGLIQATFQNLNPIAKDDEFIVKYDSDKVIQTNLLDNDSDDHDGRVESKNYPVGKPQFYVNEDGVSTPIFITESSSALEIIPEASGPCPDDVEKVCYSGQMTIKLKNQFDKFNHSFKYTVYDADGKPSATPATVWITNTATTTDDTRGKGGSFGILGVVGLIGIAVWRRTRYKS